MVDEALLQAQNAQGARFAQLMANNSAALQGLQGLSLAAVVPDANVGAGLSTQGVAGFTFKPRAPKRQGWLDKILAEMGLTMKDFAAGVSKANSDAPAPQAADLGTLTAGIAPATNSTGSIHESSHMVGPPAYER